MIFSKKLFPLISGIVITLSVAAAWAAESGSGAASGGFGGAAGSVGGFGSAGGATGGLSGAAGSMSAAAILNSLNTSASPSNSSAGTQFDSAATSARIDKSGRSRDTGNKNQDASKNDLNNQDSLEKDAKKQDALEKDKAQEKDPSLFKNEFQDFVAQSIGKTLPLFGYSLFQNAPSTFSPVEIAPVTPDYIVAPGDELSVRVWGQVEANLNVIVDRNGQINLPNIGSISVAGVAYNKLSEHIGDSISAKFNNFQIDVSMGKLHSIQLFVVGQAVSPGSYSVSSLSTLVNAIVASGGPSAKGSMRHIQLKRGNKVISDFDLYDFLIKGDKSKDVRLLAGDVIYFPPVGAMVAISGSVNTQAIFELKANDKLSDVLNLAGGLTNVAAAQTVSVERIYEHTVRKVDEFQLDKKGLESPMRDGDVVSFNSISPRFDNAVKLQGAVASPMRYVWKEGMRITDLLKDNNSLIPGAYWAVQNSGTIDSRHNKNLVNWDYAVVQRMNNQKLSNTLVAFNLGKAISGDVVENMLLQPGDVVTIFEATQVLPKADNEVVLKAGRFFGSDRHFVWHEGMRIKDLIPNAKWFIDSLPDSMNDDLYKSINWGYARILRTDINDITRKMLPFSLEKAITGNPADNKVLLAGDEITIYTSNEIKESGEKVVKYVTLEGEVKTPGIYPIEHGETLRQLISRLGGLTPLAHLRSGVFTRESIRQFQQKNLDEALRKFTRELNSAENKTTTSASKNDEAMIQKKIENQHALLDSLRDIKATGRIVLELPEENAQLIDLPDLPLEDGDHFSVSTVPTTVSVVGAVYNQSTFMYRPDRALDDYLEMAGGATNDADAENIYLVLADGTVKSNSSKSFFSGGLRGRRLHAGDLVFMPQKIDVDSFSVIGAVKDVTTIFYQFMLGAAGAKAAKVW